MISRPDRATRPAIQPTHSTRSIRLGFATIVAVLASACTSPPKAPTVDDSNKRPVNSTQAVELQSCRGELSAAKVVLFETTHDESRRVASYAQDQCRVAMANMPGSRDANRVFVVPFKTGSAEFVIPAEHEQNFLREVSKAKFILVRARTDSTKDSLAETELAKRRADAALKYILARSGKLPRDGIRLTWQGSGDPLPYAGSANARSSDRRVEIEVYASLPTYEYLSAGADL